MSVYLLHIEPPYKHARHYIGWSKDFYPDDRINHHLLQYSQSKSSHQGGYCSRLRSECRAHLAPQGQPKV